MTKLNKIELGDNAKLFPTLNNNIDIANGLIDQPAIEITDANGLVWQDGAKQSANDSRTALDAIKLPSGQYHCHLWLAATIPSLGYYSGQRILKVPSNFYPKLPEIRPITFATNGHISRFAYVQIDPDGMVSIVYTAPLDGGDKETGEEYIHMALSWETK